MTDRTHYAESKLIVALRRTAASHRRTGEPRTADLLERAAAKIAKLASPRSLTERHPASIGADAGSTPAEGTT